MSGRERSKREPEKKTSAAGRILADAAATKRVYCRICLDAEIADTLREALTTMRDAPETTVHVAALHRAFRAHFGDRHPRHEGSLRRHMREHEADLYLAVYG